MENLQAFLEKEGDFRQSDAKKDRHTEACRSSASLFLPLVSVFFAL